MKEERKQESSRSRLVSNDLFDAPLSERELARWLKNPPLDFWATMNRFCFYPVQKGVIVEVYDKKVHLYFDEIFPHTFLQRRTYTVEQLQKINQQEAVQPSLF